MKRRALLWALVGSVGGVIGLWLSRTGDRLSGLLMPRVDVALPPGKLSPPEIEAILAFAEILVEERALSPAERAPLVDHINDRTQGAAGFLSLYRDTASLLNRLAPRRFADLALAQRRALVERLHLADSQVGRLEYVWPFNRTALLTRQFVVPDLIGAYYTSPAGWAVVRYDTSPGQCGDLTRYTREER